MAWSASTETDLHQNGRLKPWVLKYDKLSIYAEARKGRNWLEYLRWSSRKQEKKMGLLDKRSDIFCTSILGFI